MFDLNFSGKTVLVIGGSSGIGNGIARAFRDRGADVHVCGTRKSPEAYDETDGGGFAGLRYTQLDASDSSAGTVTDRLVFKAIKRRGLK